MLKKLGLFWVTYSGSYASVQHTQTLRQVPSKSASVKGCYCQILEWGLSHGHFEHFTTTFRSNAFLQRMTNHSVGTLNTGLSLLTRITLHTLKRDNNNMYAFIGLCNVYFIFYVSFWHIHGFIDRGDALWHTLNTSSSNQATGTQNVFYSHTIIFKSLHNIWHFWDSVWVCSSNSQTDHIAQFYF